MELRFREGNRESFGAQVDLHFAGAGLVAEGPLSGRGSWLLCARRSFLDLLVDAIGTGCAIACSTTGTCSASTEVGRPIGRGSSACAGTVWRLQEA